LRGRGKLLEEIVFDLLNQHFVLYLERPTIGGD
jgi:hypothetical protein